jgi:hypothetical protein
VITYVGAAANIIPLNVACVARAGSGAIAYRQEARPAQTRNVSPAGQAVAIQKTAVSPTATNTRTAARTAA